MPENEDVARIFSMVRNQVITAGPRNEPIGLNHQAIKMLMDLYGVKNQKDCFERVNKLYQEHQDQEILDRTMRDMLGGK